MFGTQFCMKRKLDNSWMIYAVIRLEILWILVAKKNLIKAAVIANRMRNLQPNITNFHTISIPHTDPFHKG